MHTHHDHGHGDRNLLVAVSVNILLTAVEIVGGVLSGSLSLIADALHNLSDAGSLVVALLARRISRRPADDTYTFGYQRAEVIGSLVNLTTLVVVGLYLILEGVMRLLNPEPVVGWIMVGVSAVALIVDAITALLTWRMSKYSLNIKAAFVHNVADALGSVAVIVAGVLILVYEWYFVDVAATFLISGYVLYHGVTMGREAVHVLMDGVPASLNVEELKMLMESEAEVIDVHHMHVWQLGEQRTALEAHASVRSDLQVASLDALKRDLKQMLRDQFQIEHAIIEFESDGKSECVEKSC